MPDADVLDTIEPVERTGRLQRTAFLVGSVGLLSAAAIDGTAVLGRHTGFSVLGSIEMVQVAVVLIASSAMIGATLVGSHASVHIVTERMSAPLADRARRASVLLSALTFLLLAVGSIWVASDLWSGFERTELLAIPLRWLRAVWIAAALLIAALFVRQAWRRAQA